MSDLAPRELALRAASSQAATAFAALVDRLAPVPRGSCAVLTFHRLDVDGEGLYPGLVGPSPDAFEAMVTELARRHRPVSGSDLLAAVDGTRSLPPRALLLTFDDAYSDFGEVAWPILRRLGVPVVLFVPTAYPDAEISFWWDRLYAALEAAGPNGRARAGLEGGTALDAFRRLRPEIKAAPHHEAMAMVDRLVAELAPQRAVDRSPTLGWGELRRLREQGVELAPHSRTHPLLHRLAPGELEGEVAGSAADLAEATGSTLPLFAYPSGGHDPEVRRAVAAAGFRAAFTTAPGLARPGTTDPLQLPRVNVGRRSPTAVVLARLAARRLGRRAWERQPTSATFMG